MKNTYAILLIIPFLILASIPCAAQTPVVLKRDNGTSKGHDASLAMWEETMSLVPAGPCRLLELHIYLEGTQAGSDTIWVVGDPAEGGIPPTSNVWSYNALIPPIVVDYDGTPGWDTIDLRDANLHYDGYDRIVIQHRVKGNGPWFGIDNAVNSLSILYDPFNFPSPSFPIKGKYIYAKGDFMVRALIEYDFPNGSTSATPPAATLVDATKGAGLVDASGKLLKAGRVSVVDWNGDGWDDIAIGSSFFQNKGDGTFQNVSAALGIAAGASVWGDYDNDGKIDCYAINGGSGDKIYHNNGDGTFSDVTAASGFENPYPTVTPIWFDYDHDGKLDIFVANGRTESNGQEEYFPDQLWRGNGDGTFTNVSDAANIPTLEMEGSPDLGSYLDCWGAAPCDYNNDGWTDIFVATYRLAPDLLFKNNGNGVFTEEGAPTGIRGEPTNVPYYFGHGIGADWGDYDNDGDMDVAVGNLGHPDVRGLSSNPSLLYRNLGGPDYHFEEVHKGLGIKFFEMNAGVVWLDLDLDGYLDLWHCQYAYTPQGSTEPKRISRAYINEGPEKGFHMADRTWHLGPVMHGAWTAARGDFDRDGDMDLVVASPTEGVKLFRNTMARNGSWLELRLTGSPADNVPMDGYGTKIVVYTGGKMLTRELQGGGSGTTGTQQSNMLHFGLGSVTSVDSIVVRYPNGSAKSYTSVAANASYTIPYQGELLLTSGVAWKESMGPELRIADISYDGLSFNFFLHVPTYRGGVQVEIIDGFGSTLATSIFEGGITGTRSVRAGGMLSSGVYFVRVTAGGATVVEKVSVTK